MARVGLLPDLMRNLEDAARAAGCDELTLTSTTGENVGLFKGYGFNVEDSNTGRLAMKYGFGIPMEKQLQQ